MLPASCNWAEEAATRWQRGSRCRDSPAGDGTHHWAGVPTAGQHVPLSSRGATGQGAASPRGLFHGQAPGLPPSFTRRDTGKLEPGTAQVPVGAFSCQLAPNQPRGSGCSLAPSPERGRGVGGMARGDHAAAASAATCSPTCRAAGDGTPWALAGTGLQPAWQSEQCPHPPAPTALRARGAPALSHHRSDVGVTAMSGLVPSLLQVLSWLCADSQFGEKELLWCSKRFPGRGWQQREPRQANPWDAGGRTSNPKGSEQPGSPARPAAFR